MNEVTTEQLETMSEQELEAWSAEQEWEPLTAAEESEFRDLRPAAPLVPISLRLPADLLAEVKAQAAKSGQPYQRYLRSLLLLALREVQEGAPSPMPTQVRLSREQLRELAESGSITLQLRAS